MYKTYLFLIPIITLIFSSNALAEMYKSVDEQGNITYSDTPPEEEAEAMEPPMLNTMPTVKPRPTPATPEEEVQEETTYTSLSVQSPQNDATLRSNSGNISVSLNINPALNIQQGHYMSVQVNGITVKDKINSSSTQLTNIDRGTLSITASVKNKKGATLLSSNPITVYLHRASK